MGFLAWNHFSVLLLPLRSSPFSFSFENSRWNQTTCDIDHPLEETTQPSMRSQSSLLEASPKRWSRDFPISLPFQVPSFALKCLYFLSNCFHECLPEELWWRRNVFHRRKRFSWEEWNIGTSAFQTSLFCLAATWNAGDLAFCLYISASSPFSSSSWFVVSDRLAVLFDARVYFSTFRQWLLIRKVTDDLLFFRYCSCSTSCRENTLICLNKSFQCGWSTRTISRRNERSRESVS